MSYTQVYPLQISQTMSMSDAYVLVLDAPDTGKQVPVIIGEPEAQAIVMAIEQRQARRPLTHQTDSPRNVSTAAQAMPSFLL